MSITKEVIDALNQRIKDLAAGSTPDQLAYLAKALESIVDKSAVSEIVQMTDGKLEELLNAARSHLNDINTNKENSISAITGAKTESVNEINTLKTKTLDTLKASSDSHISQLDTRKDTNIAAINSTGADQLNNLKGLVSNFESINNVPPGSSIIGEIETRDEQLKASLINEIKTRDEQLKNTFEIISDPEILLKTINDNNLETWLSNTDNQRKFNKMLSNANAVLNITGHSSTLEPVHNLLRNKAVKARTTICKLVLSLRSQFFHNRLHFSNQAKERSTTHLFGNTAKVCNSLRFITSTVAPIVAFICVAKFSPV